MKHTRNNPERGVIALITVIILGAMLLTVGISASLIGRSEIIMTGDADRSQAVRALLDACVEEAMHRLKKNSSYTGGVVPIDTDSCTVGVTGSGNTRTVTISATMTEYTKTVVVSALRKSNGANSSSGWSVDAWAESDPP